MYTYISRFGSKLGFGYRVWGLSFRVQSPYTLRHEPQSQVEVFGFWVSGFGFWISGFGFRVLDFGFRVPEFWFHASGLGLRLSGFGFRVAGFGFGVLISRFKVWG